MVVVSVLGRGIFLGGTTWLCWGGCCFIRHPGFLLCFDGLWSGGFLFIFWLFFFLRVILSLIFSMLLLLFFYSRVWTLPLLLTRMLPTLSLCLWYNLSWTWLWGRLALRRRYFLCRDGYVKVRWVVYHTNFPFWEIWCWRNLFWGEVGSKFHCYYFFWWFWSDWYCDGWVLHGFMFLFLFCLLIFILIYGTVGRDLVRSWGCWVVGVDGGAWSLFCWIWLSVVWGIGWDWFTWGCSWVGLLLGAICGVCGSERGDVVLGTS